MLVQHTDSVARIRVRNLFPLTRYSLPLLECEVLQGIVEAGMTIRCEEIDATIQSIQTMAHACGKSNMGLVLEFADADQQERFLQRCHRNLELNCH